MTKDKASDMSGTLTADREHIARQVRKAGSSFYWAMRLMTPTRRAALFAIYGFCRTVDDIADGPLPADKKLAALTDWRRRIADLFETGAVTDDPLDRVLSDSIVHYDLQRADFEAVIRGMEMDAMGPICAPAMAELEDYCDCVASAVGRLCVRVFGAPDEVGQKLANHQGLALQLTNIIRDVEEDASMGRLYLPKSVLEEAGLDTAMPLSRLVAAPELTKARRILAQRAETEFAAAKAALAACDSGDMRPAMIMMTVYERIYLRMKANGFKPETGGRFKRTVLKLEKLWIALATALKGRP